MSWSAEQLRLLRALGHEPMRLAGAEPAFAGPAQGRAPSGPPAGAPAPTSAASAADFAALQAALARAAGGSDLAALALDLERLRRDPALKRALWPRLRALRRPH